MRILDGFMHIMNAIMDLLCGTNYVLRERKSLFAQVNHLGAENKRLRARLGASTLRAIEVEKDSERQKDIIDDLLKRPPCQKNHISARYY